MGSGSWNEHKREHKLDTGISPLLFLDCRRTVIGHLKLLATLTFPGSCTVASNCELKEDFHYVVGGGLFFSLSICFFFSLLQPSQQEEEREMTWFVFATHCVCEQWDPMA